MAGIVPQSLNEGPQVLTVNQQSLPANPQSLDEIRASVQCMYYDNNYAYMHVMLHIV